MKVRPGLQGSLLQRTDCRLVAYWCFQLVEWH